MNTKILPIDDHGEVVAAVKESLADIEAGRTIALEDYIAQVHERRRQRDATKKAIK